MHLRRNWWCVLDFFALPPHHGCAPCVNSCCGSILSCCLHCSPYGPALAVLAKRLAPNSSTANNPRSPVMCYSPAANMDQSFPDATEEDLQRADHVCIICREELTTQGALNQCTLYALGW